MPDLPLYDAIILRIFKNHHKQGRTEFEFDREELAAVAAKLGLRNPKNLGDLIYSFRYRKSLPDGILATAGRGLEWIIEPAGRAKYRFRLAPVSRIVPRADLVVIKIPDATPEIIGAYALSDEQALLAKVRYNRLVDIFLGITTYSLQNHLRTQVADVGQIEIDELYIGVSKSGAHYVIPVQAKGGKDKIGIVQLSQDLAWCRKVLPDLIARPLAVQFMADKGIAMFELTLVGEDVKVVDERQYMLVPKDDLSDSELRDLSARESGSR